MCSSTICPWHWRMHAGSFCFWFHAHKSETWATIAFVFKMYQLLLLLFLLLLFLFCHWFKMWTHGAILSRPSQHCPSSGSHGVEIPCIFTTLKIKDCTRDFLSWISLQGRVTSKWGKPEHYVTFPMKILSPWKKTFPNRSTVFIEKQRLLLNKKQTKSI